MCKLAQRAGYIYLENTLGIILYWGGLVEELGQVLQKILEESPHSFVFSLPKAQGKYTRAKVTKTDVGKWQIERFTKEQAFHKNFGENDLPQELAKLMETEFCQMVAFSSGKQFGLRISKKGKILYSSKAGGTAQKNKAHNREKEYIIKEGTLVPALVDMGIMDENGKILAAKWHKYRQINRFIEIIDQAIDENPCQNMRVVDFGCGKSSLTFLLYHYLTNLRGINAQICGLDLKKDVVEACNAAAQKYGYTGLYFAVGDVATHKEPQKVDMVISLHACDTATDHALAKAVQWQSGLIFCVPCCQHQLNKQIKSKDFAILTRYGLIKERTAALVTDAIRANMLVANGYSTQVLEFVDFAHTPKNVMIRAKLGGVCPKLAKQAMDEVESLCAAFALCPEIVSLL